MIKINTTILADCIKKIEAASNSIKATYGIFKESCFTDSNSTIQKMNTNIDSKLKQISTGCENLKKWIANCNNDILSLENYMSDNGGLGNIKEPSLRNYVASNFFPLNGYNNEFEGTFNIETPVETEKKEKTKKEDKNFLEKVGAFFTDTYNKLNDFYIKNQEIEMQIQQSQTATSATLLTGAGEGIVKLGEKLMDFSAIMGTTMQEQNLANMMPYEVLILGNTNYEQNVDAVWDSTMSFVAKDYTTSIFDNYYENNKVGKWQKEEAILFEETRAVAAGVGEIVGNVVLTATTGAPSWLIAGAAGYGAEAENAWKNGATKEEGLTAAGLNSLWEGTQYYIGGKINKWNPIKGSTNSTKALNSLLRVSADALDGSAEGIVRPFIATTYQDGYVNENGEYEEFGKEDRFIDRYKEVFDDYGGWSNVGVQGLTGLGFSLLGEVDTLTKLFKKQGKTDPSLKKVTDTDKLLDQIDEINGLDDNYKGIRQITVDSLDDLTLEDLNKLTSPNLVLFLTSDGTTYTFSEIKKRLNKGLIMKQQLIDSALEIENPIEKSRKLYYELNKKVHYDLGFTFDRGSGYSYRVLNNIVTFENLNKDNNIVCKGWAELYRELLLASGFDESQVSIQGNGHYWVEIDLLDGNIIIADATERIGFAPGIDLANCKAELPTNGFIKLDKNKYSGSRLTYLCNPFEDQKLDASVIDANKTMVMQVDETLGYVKDGKYMLENIEKAQSLFDDDKLFDKIFKRKSKDKLIEEFFDLKIPENMDGYELFRYYDFCKNKLLEKEASKIDNFTRFLKNGDRVEPIGVLHYFDKDTNKTIFQVYSETIGKKRFYSEIEFDNFMNQLEGDFVE